MEREGLGREERKRTLGDYGLSIGKPAASGIQFVFLCACVCACVHACVFKVKGLDLGTLKVFYNK